MILEKLVSKQIEKLLINGKNDMQKRLYATARLRFGNYEIGKDGSTVENKKNNIQINKNSFKENRKIGGIEIDKVDKTLEFIRENQAYSFSELSQKMFKSPNGVKIKRFLKVVDPKLYEEMLANNFVIPFAKDKKELAKGIINVAQLNREEQPLIYAKNILIPTIDFYTIRYRIASNYPVRTIYTVLTQNALKRAGFTNITDETILKVLNIASKVSTSAHYRAYKCFSANKWATSALPKHLIEKAHTELNISKEVAEIIFLSSGWATQRKSSKLSIPQKNALLDKAKKQPGAKLKRIILACDASIGKSAARQFLKGCNIKTGGRGLTQMERSKIKTALLANPSIPMVKLSKKYAPYRPYNTVRAYIMSIKNEFQLKSSKDRS